MTEEQHSRKVAELKAAIAGAPRWEGGTPPEVRAQVVLMKREAIERGKTARAVAKQLGIHPTTLCRWEREERILLTSKNVSEDRRGQREEESFRVVRVVGGGEGKEKSAPLVEVKGGAVVKARHIKSGVEIEGLDLEGLVTLLRRLS